MNQRSLLVLALLAGTCLPSAPARAQPPPVTARVEVPPGTRGRVIIAPLAADRLFLGGRRHRALAGFAVRWERFGEHPWLPVTVTLDGLPERAGAPATRRRHLGATLPAQWVHAVHGAGARRRISLDVPPHQTVELLWADLASYRDWSGPYRLVADPLDPHPLGDRKPLVLVHGLLWSSPDRPFSQLMQDVLTRNFSKHPDMRGLRRDYKLYAFEWPSFAGSAVAGRELARALRALYPDAAPPPQSIVMVAHSMGGLVARRALSTAGLGESVRHVFTLATPHRGTLVASLARCGEGLAGVVGSANVAILRNFTGFLVPSCAALDDLAWDDHDGTLSRPDLLSMGIRLNRELAAFNASDRYLDRVTALSGDCPDLRKDLLGLPLDYIRSAQGILGAHFANSDPLVPRDSGTFKDAPVQRGCLKRANHLDWALSADVAGRVLGRVADL